MSLVKGWLRHTTCILSEWGCWVAIPWIGDQWTCQQWYYLILRTPPQCTPPAPCKRLGTTFLRVELDCKFSLGLSSLKIALNSRGGCRDQPWRWLWTAHYLQPGTHLSTCYKAVAGCEERGPWSIIHSTNGNLLTFHMMWDGEESCCTKPIVGDRRGGKRQAIWWRHWDYTQKRRQRCGQCVGEGSNQSALHCLHILVPRWSACVPLSLPSIARFSAISPSSNPSLTTPAFWRLPLWQLVQLTLSPLPSPSRGFCNPIGRWQRSSAEGGARQVHLQCGPELMVSIVYESSKLRVSSSTRRQASRPGGLNTHLQRQPEPSDTAFNLS